MHNRVRVYFSGRLLPLVWKSKCDALMFLRQNYPGGLTEGILEVVTVWRGEQAHHDKPPSGDKS